MDDTICTILGNFKRIAVVGLSDRPTRDSNSVAGYLVRQGYSIIPVNPLISDVFGIQCYPDLISAPRPIEVVNIFRRKEFIPEIVDQAIEVGARVIWAQLGLEDEIAAKRAREAGMLVVMNRCIAVEHSRHFGQR